MNGATALVVVPSATDLAASHPKKHQDHADHGDKDAKRPKNRNLGNEPNQHEDQAENNHLYSFAR